jgi:hypothetical protein
MLKVWITLYLLITERSKNIKDLVRGITTITQLKIGLILRSYLNANKTFEGKDFKYLERMNLYA